MEAYDFYAYWNGREAAELWSVIAAMTATDDFRTLLASFMTCGFLAVMIGAAARNRGMDALTWFAATVLIFSIAYIPRVTITVKDVRAGYAQAVEGVPLGIGWPASVTSSVSWWLTQTFETAFQDVDASSFSRFGVAFPQRAVSALMAMGPVTEKGREYLRVFTERCVVPEMLDNPEKRRAVLEAKDIYLLVAEKDWVNPARRVVIDGSVVTCADALPQLTQYLSETEIPAMENVLLTKLDVGSSDVIAAATLAAVPGAEELMLGTSRTLTESLRQSLMLSVIPDSMLTAAAKAGKAPLSASVALARAQGNLASEINYRTLADMAKSALPKVRNVLEFIVIGLFPVMLLMMAGLGLAGLTVIRSYLTLLISVALWAPITAVINYLTVHVDAEPLNRLVDSAGGVTLSAATLIREAGASSQAMAGALMWLVPVLAYAVAKGSDMAVTSMASSVLAPASAAAQAQGSAMAMGNVSAGNASVGNTSVNNASGNKSDMSSAYTSPDVHRSVMAEGSWQGSRATGAITAMSIAESNLGVSTQGGQSYGVALEDVSSSSHASSHVQGSSIAESRVNVSAETTQGTVTNTGGLAVTRGFGTEQVSGTMSTYSHMQSNTASAGFMTAGSSSESFSVNSGVQASAGGASPAAGAVGPAEVGVQLPGSTAGTAVPAMAGAVSLGGQNGGSANPLQTGGPRLGAGVGGVTGSQKQDSASIGASSSDARMTGEVRSNGRHAAVSDSVSESSTHSAVLGHMQSASSSSNQQVSETAALTRHSSSSNNRQFSDRSQAQITTGVALNSAVRDEALRVFGSPQEALAALNRSTDTRMAFGRHMQTKARENDRFTDVVGNTVPTPDYSNPTNKLNEQTMRQTYEADSAGISAAHEATAAGIHRDGASLRNESNGFMPVSESDREQLYLVRGMTIAASAKYQKTETGMISVGSRSFLFGMGYASPAEMYRTMEAKSQTDPAFREALIRLGKDAGSVDRPLSSNEVLARLER